MRGGDAVQGLLVAILLPANGEVVLLAALEIGRRHRSADQASPGKVVPHQSTPDLPNSGEALYGSAVLSDYASGRAKRRMMRRQLGDCFSPSTRHRRKRCSVRNMPRHSADAASGHAPQRLAAAAAKEKPGREGRVAIRVRNAGRSAYAASSCSASSLSALAPRFGPLLRLTSIRRTASVSDILLTAAISRAMRSSAAS